MRISTCPVSGRDCVATTLAILKLALMVVYISSFSAAGGFHVHSSDTSMRYTSMSACAHTYVYMHAYLHACMCVCMHVCMYVYMHVCMYVHMYSCLHPISLDNASDIYDNYPIMIGQSFVFIVMYPFQPRCIAMALPSSNLAKNPVA